MKLVTPELWYRIFWLVVGARLATGNAGTFVA